MLFFRSEELRDGWCDARNLPRRPLVTIPQLWGLANAWYANRLAPDARRPQPDEMRDIFARLGLMDPFWDPRSDSFRS
jgi:hypothetical protein